MALWIAVACQVVRPGGGTCLAYIARLVTAPSCRHLWDSPRAFAQRGSSVHAAREEIESLLHARTTLQARTASSWRKIEHGWESPTSSSRGGECRARKCLLFAGATHCGQSIRSCRPRRSAARLTHRRKVLLYRKGRDQRFSPRGRSFAGRRRRADISGRRGAARYPLRMISCTLAQSSMRPHALHGMLGSERRRLFILSGTCGAHDTTAVDRPVSQLSVAPRVEYITANNAGC